MVLIATAPYLDEQARALLQRYSSIEDLSEQDWEDLRQEHKQGDTQIRSVMTTLRGFLNTYDDMNFTKPYLGIITAHTLIIHGDRDPEFKVTHAVQMYQSIPHSYLWVLPNGDHWPLPQSQDNVFTKTVLEFLRGDWER